MATGSFFAGLLEGLGSGISENQARAKEQRDKEDAREQGILTSLAGDETLPDDVRAGAVSGLLDMASGAKRPRQGYLSRLIGRKDVSIHPAVQSVLNLVQQHLGPTGAGGAPGAADTTEAGAAPAPAAGAPPAIQPQTAPANPLSVKRGVSFAPATPASAAMPATAAIQPGGGPAPSQLPSPGGGGGGTAPSGPAGPVQPSPAAVAQAKVAPALVPPPPLLPTGMGHLFKTSDERAAEAAHAATVGTQAKYDWAYRQKYNALPADLDPREKHAQATRAAEIYSGMTPASSLVPRNIPGTISADELAGEIDVNGAQIVAGSGKHYRARVVGNETQYWPTDTAATKPTPLHGIATDPTTKQPSPTGAGTPASYLRWPDGRMEFLGFATERDQNIPVTRTLPDGSQYQEVVTIPATHGGATGTAAPPPPPAPTSAGAGGAAKPGAAPSATAATPPPSPHVTTTPLGATKPPQYKTANVVVPGQTRPIPALETADGQFVDPLTKQPIPGAQKVPDSAVALTSQERQTLDQIHAALPMIQRVRESLRGREGENPLLPLDAGKAWLEYSTLHREPSDPFYGAYFPLVKLMDVFITKGYLSGIRNQAWIQQIQQHVPHQLDSPKLALEKLQNIEDTFKQVEQDLAGGGEKGYKIISVKGRGGGGGGGGGR